MRKIDKTVKKESLYVALWVLVLSVIMQSVFLVIGKWDYTVLLGNIYSYVLSVANFFFMALTVQVALEKEPKEAKSTIKLSQSLRTLALFCFAALGAYLPPFNVLAVLIPLLFPRIAVAIRGIALSKSECKSDSQNSQGEQD